VLRDELQPYYTTHAARGAGLDLFAARLDPAAAAELKPAALLSGGDGGEGVFICWVSISAALASWIATGGEPTLGRAALDAGAKDFASGIIGLRYGYSYKAHSWHIEF
jgi:hypothetical protein